MVTCHYFSLFAIGIEVSTPDGTKVIKAAIIGISCDLPARALVLNMRQFNGKNGCHLCEDDGKNPPESNLVRYWPYSGEPVPRTRASLIENSRLSISQNETVGLVNYVFLFYVHILSLVQRCESTQHNSSP